MGDDAFDRDFCYGVVVLQDEWWKRKRWKAT
jgi:hypothetical protein